MHRITSPTALGTTLRNARKAIQLTQPELALAAGVGVRFIVDLEAGKPTVRLDAVLRVVDALGGVLALHDLPSSVVVESGTDATHVGAEVATAKVQKRRG